ncbi:MAG: hypothetical protein WDM89_21530 [Rhizomicrobium sp.]
MAGEGDTGNLRKNWIALFAAAAGLLALFLATPPDYSPWSSFMQSLFPAPTAPAGWKCEGAGCRLTAGEWTGIQVGEGRHKAILAFCRAAALHVVRTEYTSGPVTKESCLSVRDSDGQDSISLENIFFLLDQAKGFEGFGCRPFGGINGDLIFDKTGQRLESIEVWCSQLVM